MTDSRNLFVSHLHEDDARVGGFKDLLSSHAVEVRDSSITADKPNEANNKDYIRSQVLAPRIRWAGTMVVIVTPETKRSEWVNWEIEYGHRLGKRIIGVWGYGASESDLPEALERYANAVVGWNAERITDAIDGADNWETPEGAPRPLQPIARYRC